MRDLRVGDMVLADGAIFEPVYFFGHADGAATRAYVMLHLQKHNKTVRVAGDHFVPLGKGRTHKYADAVEIGARAVAWDGVELFADLVDDKAYEDRAGFYEPYTRSGFLVVDGVLSSCHAAPRGWWWLDRVWPTEGIKFLPNFYQALGFGPRLAVRLFGATTVAAAFRQEL